MTADAITFNEKVSTECQRLRTGALVKDINISPVQNSLTKYQIAFETNIPDLLNHPLLMSSDIVCLTETQLPASYDTKNLRSLFPSTHQVLFNN